MKSHYLFVSHVDNICNDLMAEMEEKVRAKMEAYHYFKLVDKDSKGIGVWKVAKFSEVFARVKIAMIHKMSKQCVKWHNINYCADETLDINDVPFAPEDDSPL